MCTLQFYTNHDNSWVCFLMLSLTLIFSTNSAKEWTQEHGGSHYPSFYYFLVDYFEDHDTDNKVTTASVNLNDLLV